MRSTRLQARRRRAADPGTRSAARARTPRPSNPLASTPPASSAPISAEQRRVLASASRPASSSGPSRVPRNAPSANPTSDSSADDEALQVAVEAPAARRTRRSASRVRHAPSARRTGLARRARLAELAAASTILRRRFVGSQAPSQTTFSAEVATVLMERARAAREAQCSAPAAADARAAAGDRRGGRVRGRRDVARRRPVAPQRALVTRVRPRVGARRLPAHVLAARPRVAARGSPSPVRRRVPERGAAPRRSRSIAPAARRQQHGGVIPVAMLVRHRRVRHAARDLLGAARPAAARVRTVQFSARCCSRGCGPASSSAARTQLPPRAALLASDGTPLAQGPNRTSPIPDVAGQIVGTLGPIPAADGAPRYAAAGLSARREGRPWTGSSGSSSISSPARRAARCWPGSACSRTARRCPGGRSRPRSTPRSSAPRSPRWPAATPGSPRWTRAPARCWRSPASRSRRCSRPARR